MPVEFHASWHVLLRYCFHSPPLVTAFVAVFVDLKFFVSGCLLLPEATFGLRCETQELYPCLQSKRRIASSLFELCACRSHVHCTSYSQNRASGSCPLPVHGSAVLHAGLATICSSNEQSTDPDTICCKIRTARESSAP